MSIRSIPIRMALSASVLGGTCLFAGCGGGSKGDGQIPPSPEAQNASQAISEQYSQQYGQQYANKKGAGKKGAAKQKAE